MDERQTPVELAERVADIARSLGIETALIGAYALAAYHYVRGTTDIDLASNVELERLRALEHDLKSAGFKAALVSPDDEDVLGGKLTVWVDENEDGDPVEPVEVVNYFNPYRPRNTPAAQAIKNATILEGKPALRYPRLSDLIALKLFAGALRDEADVVEVLVKNPGAELEEIRSVCWQHGLKRIDALIDLANAERRQRR